ncbi:hypothetical protein JG688_00015737 [Phytophthora aleatoria]|uniref:Uncharacterized protein n=1 Tax=Phytophthora aleatoria TaxID=2496075 RepID=A0A8J5MCT6_9STRA|nr:hypothetical protein JG688_00015737 [Phytophthora aleatoria]
MDSHSGGKCPSSWPNNLNDLNDHSDVSMRGSPRIAPRVHAKRWSAKAETP